MSEQLSGPGMAWASVVLGVAIDVPARFAVPVQVRNHDMKLSGWVSADGRDYAVPSGVITFLAVLPDGDLLQASTDIPSQSRARITLQRNRAPKRIAPRERPPLLEQQRTALRFLAQSSLDTYKRTREPSVVSAAIAAADELRLQLTSHATGVQFLQLLSSGTFPIFVAYSGNVTLKLVRLDQRMVADVSAMDERAELALQYLQAHRVREASTVLERHGLMLRNAEQSNDIVTILCWLHVQLASGQLEKVEEAAARLTQQHSNIADFAIIAAECAAARDDYRAALDYLAILQEAGLPLLYRSYVMATARLAGYLARKDPERSVDQGLRDVLSSISTRLESLASTVDPSSVLLVVLGQSLKAPSLTLSWWQRLAQPLIRITAPYIVKVGLLPAIRSEKGINVANAIDPTPSPANLATNVQNRGPSTFLQQTAGAAIVGLWAGMALYLMFRSGDAEVTWSRLALVFSSVQAVVFGAAGLLFGVTINRQRAERAEARADANQQDAERGRSLAAALKAEEPITVIEPSMASPLAPSRDQDLASQIATRHARLARQLFP
jgi:hypothetical protein